MISVLYEEVTDSKCITESLSRGNCSMVAHHNSSTFAEISDPYLPGGCYMKKNWNRIYFNSETTPYMCSKERRCLCVGR